MTKNTKNTVLLILVLLTSVALVYARPITSFNYVTNFETSEFNEMIWFQTGDTLYGPLHSNDYIGIFHSPSFYGQVSTSQDRFLEFEANPYFRYEPVFNAPTVEFPEDYAHLRQGADLWIDSRNGTMMTWMRLDGASGIDVYQYQLGTPRSDSLIAHVNPEGNKIIYIDGEVEVEGELVGRLTVYSHGDMWLLDNILYRGSNRSNGGFEEDEMQHQLALVSDENIIVKDNWVNGRQNGAQVAPGDINRHSIIINASLITHNGSFTIEHQNDEWDAYQGPMPDDRGYIHLRGSVAQWRKGYLHRSNHDGTGYHLALNFDYRLSRGEGPPGFGSIKGRHGIIRLSGDDYNRITISNASIDTLIISAGVEVILDGPNALEVRNRLVILGTEESPVRFTMKYHNARSTFRVSRGAHSYVGMDHVQFDEGIILRFDCDSLISRACEFGDEVVWTGRILADSSQFHSSASLTSHNDLEVSHCRFDNGLVIDGRAVNGNVVNNTMVGGRNPGVYIRSFNSLTLKNNIIAFNRTGIVGQYYDEPVLTFNNVFGNWDGDYLDCAPGDGSISADPLFYDPRREDYHLLWGSPCIDAGDPDMPPDADGTRCDMGAYAFDHGHPQEVGEEFPVTMPDDFGIVTVSPNPFNSSTTIVFNVTKASENSLDLLDISGRKIRELSDGHHAVGRHSFSLQGSGLTAGVYFVVLESAGQICMKKVVYLR